MEALKKTGIGKIQNISISGFDDFDSAMSRILTVSYDELKRRDKEWKKQRKRKRGRKTGDKIRKDHERAIH
jgi:hypothetical protein